MEKPVEPDEAGCKSDPEVCQGYVLAENVHRLSPGERTNWESISAKCGLTACAFNFQGRQEASKNAQIELARAALRHEAEQRECFGESWSAPSHK